MIKGFIILSVIFLYAAKSVYTEIKENNEQDPIMRDGIKYFKKRNK